MFIQKKKKKLQVSSRYINTRIDKREKKKELQFVINSMNKALIKN